MNRVELLAFAALKKAKRKPLRGPDGKAGRDGETRIVHEVREVPAPSQKPAEGAAGVGVEDFRIEQEGAEIQFVLTLTDGTEIRRQAELPKPKNGKDGKPGLSQPVLQMRAFTRPTNVVSTAFDGDGKLVITFTDGSTLASDNAGGGGAAGVPIMVADEEQYVISENTQVLFHRPIEFGAGSSLFIEANAELIGV